MNYVDGTEQWFADVIASRLCCRHDCFSGGGGNAHRLLGTASSRQNPGQCARQTSLVPLWRDEGNPDEAPDHVWFTGGFDTLELKEAKALLDELHA